LPPAILVIYKGAAESCNWQRGYPAQYRKNEYQFPAEGGSTAGWERQELLNNCHSGGFSERQAELNGMNSSSPNGIKVRGWLHMV